MGRFSALLVALFLSLVPSLDAAAVEPGTDAVLESISYEKDDNNNEKIIFKLNGAHIPKVFKIKGERPRLVFDFLDTRYSDLINRITDTKGSLVQGVRVGIHNDPPKTRVVIDLKAEGDIKFEQDFVAPENTLSITFHPDEPEPSPPVAEAKPEPAAEPAAEPAPEQVASVPPSPPAAKSTGAQQTAAATTPPAPPGPAAAQTDPDTVFAEPAPAIGAQVEAASPEPLPEVQEAEEKAEPAATAAVQPASPPAPAAAAPEPEPAPLPEPVLDPVLSDVSFETTADNTEMILFKLNDFYPPIVFGIEKGNPRVVCDFLDTEVDKGVRPILETKGNYISRVRVAKHKGPDKVRVVLDLVPNRNYDLQQVFFKEDNLFIILINEFEEEAVPAAELDTEPEPKS